MLERVAQLRAVLELELSQISTVEQADGFRLRHLVRKGTVQQMIDEMRSLPTSEKPAVGRELNVLKAHVETEFATINARLQQNRKQQPTIDASLPARRTGHGSVHPIVATIQRVVDIFGRMGFSVAHGPDVEDERHNFSSLNFPDDHPARDMQDTFFVQSNPATLLLRTHTSSVQVRVMETVAPPIRCIMPGRVYRNEAVSSRSLAEFHQVEGLYIDRNVSMADLKGTITAFARQFYSADARFRFRTSYFPFTEPSLEVDMSCFLCKGDGCRICKHSGWLEIAGCGMVHPNVLASAGINPEEYTGFAFGFGLERIVMMQTGIDDIRLLYQNDVRVLQQL